MWDQIQVVMLSIKTRLLPHDTCKELITHKAENMFGSYWTLKEWLIAAGLFYGYPRCCVERFVIFPRPQYEGKLKKFLIEYFVPCNDCAAIIKTHWK